MQGAHAAASRHTFHTAIDALQRYLQFFGPSDKADGLPAMLEDLADLFEQSAADGTPLREVVGEDPVELAGAFLRNYPQGRWIQPGAETADQRHQSRHRSRHGRQAVTKQRTDI
ncbi:DUF1048 domain-containing protein [Nonomuraea sp. NPDC049152]|uniref:DUF1048 domain-containing protein n=1 Tax=Nonomuraea sp. NPDC049152 TaxID=3154350 RepID=UPI0033FAE491